MSEKRITGKQYLEKVLNFMQEMFLSDEFDRDEMRRKWQIDNYVVKFLSDRGILIKKAGKYRWVGDAPNDKLVKLFISQVRNRQKEAREAKRLANLQAPTDQISGEEIKIGTVYIDGVHMGAMTGDLVELPNYPDGPVFQEHGKDLYTIKTPVPFKDRENAQFKINSDKPVNLRDEVYYLAVKYGVQKQYLTQFTDQVLALIK